MHRLFTRKRRRILNIQRSKNVSTQYPWNMTNKMFKIMPIFCEFRKTEVKEHLHRVYPYQVG
jgi:hypothetical protein